MKQHDHLQNKPEHSPKGLNQEAGNATTYTCPMHPEVKSDQPGNCPKCGMKLEKKN